tara:strand:- start:1319 stop:2287 length:969 start_codon:yes stop_codon:yes gene_type:complete
VTGWLLIFSLLVLGGLLSTLGDRLGTRVGKARLSIFKLRPKRTAIFITAMTGSFISAISFGFMLLVSRQLRVGLFELDDLQLKLQESKLALQPLKKERKLLEERIIIGEKELKKLENNLIALRRGNVVISSGQSLASAIIDSDQSKQINQKVENLLQNANFYSYLRIRPGEKPDRRILLVRRDHIDRIEEIVKTKGSWIVNIRSAGNVLRGENYIYAFPEVIENKKIVVKDEIISSLNINLFDLKAKDINKKMKMLLASTLAEVKRRGSLSSELQINVKQINALTRSILNSDRENVKLNAISVENSFTSDPVLVRLELFNKE